MAFHKIARLFCFCILSWTLYCTPLAAWSKNYKIVSLAPSNTELIYALGGEDKLCGISSFCQGKSTIVGSFVSASYEKLAVIKPDVILLVQGQEALAYQLQKRHYKVEILPNERIGDISNNLKKIGRLLEMEKNANELSLVFDAQIDKLEKITKARNKCKTLVCVWAEPIICVGKKSFINDLVTVCGGRNVLSGKDLGYARISQETLLSTRPDLIILPNEAIGTKTLKKMPWVKLCQRPGVKTDFLPKNKSDFLSRPSLRVIEGLAWLATLQHPEEKLRIKLWLDAAKVSLFKKNINP